MDTLFPPDPVYPPGFSYVPDFLTSQEEQRLIREIAAVELHASNFHGYEAKRRVASSATTIASTGGRWQKAGKFPLHFRALQASKTGISKEAFAELLVTGYPEGSAINGHRDAFPFDVIAGISLLSDCTFRLRPTRPAEADTRICDLPAGQTPLPVPHLRQGTDRMAAQHQTL